MAKLFLSASSTLSPSIGRKLVIVSVTNVNGTSVSKLKASAFEVSRVKEDSLIQATLETFQELAGFYIMTLSDPQLGTKALPLLAISVRHVHVLPDNTTAHDEGHIAIPEG